MNSTTARINGTFLFTVGVLGLIATAVLVALGWRLVDRTGTTLARSLELTSEAVAAVDETIAVAADTVEAAAGGLAAITSGVADSEVSLQAAGNLLSDTGAALSADVPKSIDAIRETMPALIQSAEVLNTALGALAVFGVDFAPQTPPADSLRRVESGLAGIAERLRTGSGDLNDLGRGLTNLGAAAGSLAFELASLEESLRRADTLLAGYTATTTRTAQLVAETSSDLDAQRREGRLIVLLLGLVIALGQAIPLHLAWQSRRGDLQV